MPKYCCIAVVIALLLVMLHSSLALCMPLVGSGGGSSRTGPPPALMVVTTLPILKEFAEQVGREHVRVTSLISGLESEHSYSPKPSDLKAIAQARLLFEIGLGLEVWVHGLVKNAGNPGLRVITTSRGISVIRDSESDQDSPGNPHIWLDPKNAKLMTRHIAEGLIEADPDHKGEYQANLDLYLHRLDESEKDLQRRVAPLQDRRIVTYHPAWPYFAHRFGFQIVDNIIRQVGAEPSAAHLTRLAHRMKTEKIKVVVSEPQLNPKVPQVLAGETGARIVVLSPLPGGMKGTETYLAMLAYNITRLVEALQS